MVEIRINPDCELIAISFKNHQGYTQVTQWGDHSTDFTFTGLTTGEIDQIISGLQELRKTAEVVKDA